MQPPPAQALSNVFLLFGKITVLFQKWDIRPLFAHKRPPLLRKKSTGAPSGAPVLFSFFLSLDLEVICLNNVRLLMPHHLHGA